MTLCQALAILLTSNRLPLAEVCLYMDQNLRLAIVEDNATARTNLRSHLLPAGRFDIHSFSNGNELRSAIRRASFDIIMIDYHLGQHKNGVECIHALTVSGHIRPSTGIFFLTGDRLPKTIGQIMDLHPDVLMVKPYTMATLSRNLNHYLEVRELVSEIMHNMDNKMPSAALRQMKALLIEAQKPKSKTHKYITDLNKLFARLLMQNGFFSSALKLYESVLSRSDKVLWAHWGKIKCQFILGEWQQCEQDLQNMVKTNFTRDKAFEWLASISVASESYEQATDYLDNINVSDMSMSATRLKTLAYRKQNKVIEGLTLLQKQREHNRSTRELFDEFSYELAEFYIAIAEQTPVNQREESLSQARRLVGMAARGESDLQQKVKRDVLMAYTAALDEDMEKAKRIIDEVPVLSLNNAHPSALLTAAKTFNCLGDKETARSLLSQAELLLSRSEDQTWLSVMNFALTDSEKSVGVDQEKAVRLNEEGMALFANNQAEKAMPLFFEAHHRIPTMPAFSLNLLQCLVELKRDSFRDVSTNALMTNIESISLNETNQLRFKKLKEILKAR